MLMKLIKSIVGRTLGTFSRDPFPGEDVHCLLDVHFCSVQTFSDAMGPISSPFTKLNRLLED
eukprot:3616002-Amphidinium_carterae.1